MTHRKTVYFYELEFAKSTIGCRLAGSLITHHIIPRTRRARPDALMKHVSRGNLFEVFHILRRHPRIGEHHKFVTNEVVSLSLLLLCSLLTDFLDSTVTQYYILLQFKTPRRC